MSDNIVIPWIKPTNHARMETVKWSITNTCYEVALPFLQGLEIGEVLQHCLDVRHRVLNIITNNAHEAPSLFRVFPQTISAVLRCLGHDCH